MKQLDNNFLGDMGQRIKILREKNNFTQEQLAELTGLSSRSISSFETGQQEMGILNAHKVSATLNTTLSYLLYGEYDFNAENILNMLRDCPPDKISKIEAIVKACLEL
ncbi:helix-turn-helix domain-containing protein [Tyzzerella sp. OttesenSCG-928-J15]|nr:helix-turn-helix domain-containing protein [Tyzzerella sp. OttesenSCG-928-J15]